ncbi:unnamed protein product, partial [Meganyctiphanes norvegica]
SSECVWLWCVARGYLRPIPYGDRIILVTTLAVLGYYYKTNRPLNKFIHSIMRYIFGTEESQEDDQTQNNSVFNKADITDNELTVRKFNFKLSGKHQMCLHENSCLYSMMKV